MKGSKSGDHQALEILEENKRLKKENKKLKSKLNSLNDNFFNVNSKQVINKITDAIYFFRLYDDGQSSNFIEVNRSAYARLGYTYKEMLNMSTFDIDSTLDVDEIVKLNKKVNNYKTLSFESFHKCKSGRTIPVEINSHRIDIKGERYILAVCRDITERRNSEELLNNTKENLEKLIESSTNGTAVIQNDKIIFVNQTLLDLFGADKKEQLLGKSIAEFLRADSDYVNDYHKLTHQDQRPKSAFFILKTLQGKEVQTEINSISLNIQNKPAVQLIIKDITEQKQAEQMLLQAEKMNIVGQLAAGIAHEIRNPLTSLKGFVQLFRSGTVPEDTFLTIMENELERINVISNEFLTLAKPYNLDFAKVDVRKLLNSVVDLLETEAFSHSIVIVTKIISKEQFVNGISTELKQVFINLIKNAIDAMPNGGMISITVVRKQKFINISIKDQGIGIPNEQIKRLGEPFYTTKEKGTGLGLMVSYKIIQNHKGEIHVRSKTNEGSIFTVKLPQAIN